LVITHPLAPGTASGNGRGADDLEAARG
jgi:hypothetical protein